MSPDLDLLYGSRPVGPTRTLAFTVLAASAAGPKLRLNRFEFPVELGLHRLPDFVGWRAFPVEDKAVVDHEPEVCFQRFRSRVLIVVESPLD